LIFSLICVRYQQNSQKIIENIKNKQNAQPNQTENPASMNNSNYNPQNKNQLNNYMAPPGQSSNNNSNNIQKSEEYNPGKNNEINKQSFVSQGDLIKNANLNQSYYSISKRYFQNLIFSFK
jgi:hypothetical protein